MGRYRLARINSPPRKKFCSQDRVCFFDLPRRDLMGPAAAGRPLRSMSPGLRLRLRPPPLLTPEGHPHPALGTLWRRNAWLAAKTGVRVTRRVGSVGDVAPTYGRRNGGGSSGAEPRRGREAFARK